MTPLEVGSWVETPAGLGKVVRVRRATRWIFRRPHAQVWIEVRLIDGERRQFRPEQIGVRP